MVMTAFLCMNLAGMLVLMVAGTSPATYSSGVGVTLKFFSVKFFSLEHPVSSRADAARRKREGWVFIVL